jgi:hypothetical protein
MTKENIKRCVVGIMLLLVICLLLLNTATPKVGAGGRQGLILEPSLDSQEKQAEQEKPAEQVFKNIQVLKGLPSSQLRPAMSFIAASLGVSCSYCHINPWDSDTKPTKQTARRMILMMRRINQENFGGRVVVNCATCHRGQTTPVSIPPFARATDLPTPKVETKDAAPLLTVDQVFDNYLKALGGKAALDRLTTRLIRVTEISTDGSKTTVEMYLKAPLKMLSITTAAPPSKNVYMQGFDGYRAWGQINRGRVVSLEGTELAQATRDAEFYKGISYFKGEFAHITLKGREQIDGRDVYVIEGMNTEDFRERLFFDAKTWLLVRRYGEIKTALGPIPFQADYEDYREVDGVKLPFTVRWSLPGNGWTDTIKEIKHNVPIDDEKFNMPATKK